MNKSVPVEIITPPNVLKHKIGGPLGALDPEAIARAEAALKSLGPQFDAWMDEELERLENARLNAAAAGYDPKSLTDVYARVHDIKGLAGTYEFPLVTRIAHSLCRLIDDEAARATAPKSLILAHLDAIKAAVKRRIRLETDPVGGPLVAELEMRVKEVLPNN